MNLWSTGVQYHIRRYEFGSAMHMAQCCTVQYSDAVLACIVNVPVHQGFITPLSQCRSNCVTISLTRSGCHTAPDARVVPEWRGMNLAPMGCNETRKEKAHTTLESPSVRTALSIVLQVLLAAHSSFKCKRVLPPPPPHLSQAPKPIFLPSHPFVPGLQSCSPSPEHAHQLQAAAFSFRASKRSRKIRRIGGEVRYKPFMVTK